MGEKKTEDATAASNDQEKSKKNDADTQGMDLSFI
jgi:hypothetical protein